MNATNSVIRRLALVVALALVGLASHATVALAAEEGVTTGLVQAVDEAGGSVVIGGQRYRTNGQRVQPPKSVSAEDERYRTRPFQEGMIVRFTTEPGQPPAIKDAWAME